MLPGFGSNVTSFASGGTTPSNEIFRVGESGPELMFSSRQHYVANQQMMAGVGGGGSQPVELVIRSGGSQMDDLLVQILSRAVQVRGGDGAVLGIRTVSS
jgi:hypothetical protein